MSEDTGNADAPKDATIILRTTAENKSKIEAAAHLGGESITTFMLTSALKRAAAVQRNQQKEKGPFPDVPQFFRALCREASKGGANNYQDAGYRLAGALCSMTPRELEQLEWHARLDELMEAWHAPDWDPAMEWFEKYLPKCYELVPPRRRVSFINGVFDYVDMGNTLY